MSDKDYVRGAGWNASGLPLFAKEVIFWLGVKINKRGSTSRGMSFDGIIVRQRADIIITFSGKQKRITSLWV